MNRTTRCVSWSSLIRLGIPSGFFLILFACMADLWQGGASGPRQGWDSRHGMVISHDLFPSDCSLCHLSGSWQKIREDFEFDHERETGIALAGAHQGAQCLRCHNDRGPVGVFARRGCRGCHEDIHKGQLGRDCAACHSENNWLPSGQIAEHDRTRFPLMGAHVGIACYRCHPGAQVGNFSRADTDCHTCHEDDLRRAVLPDHTALGWIMDCQRCHAPTAWKGKGFIHDGFPLTGAHLAAPCKSCHAGGIYKGLPSQCYACHLAEYNATTNPDHQFAGFPTACEICHNTHSWKGAFFNHSFPITTGKHKNLLCSDCHLNPGSASSFSCTHCHAHDKSTMDEKHKEVNGYSWKSQACLGCHPNGKS